MPRREYDQDDDGFGEASRYTAHLDRGWSLLDRGDYQRARNSAHQALKIRPEVPDAAMLMAAISLAESDPESSLEWYERAIEADADYVDAQLAAAQLLLYDLEDPQRALMRASHARDLDEATLADQLDFGLIEVEALVALDDRGAAAERLDQLTELWVLDQLLDAETPREELARLLREFAGDPPEFDSEDIEPIMGRVVQFAIRVARLHMDLGVPDEALPWLDGLLRRFGDDADVWYLCNEAAYMAGEPVRAAHAALQVLQLDARQASPEWSPQPADIHSKVVDLLVNCADPDLRVLAREPGFVVVVNEAPPFELVLEGVDPRARTLALAARSIRDTDVAPTLTGLALYRRNLLRLAREPAQLDKELELSVFDELAVFFGYDDARRERLGLPPSDWLALGEPRPRGRETDVGPTPSAGESGLDQSGERRQGSGRKQPLAAGESTLPAADKATGRQPTAKRKAGAKKSTSKKAAAKKPAAKKTTAKKPAAKKPATKKPASKKPATKKPATKKSATKKSATKKSATKKSATKKSATKKSASKKSASKESTAGPATKKSASKKSTKGPATKRPTSKPAAAKRSAAKPAAKKAAKTKPALVIPKPAKRKSVAKPKQSLDAKRSETLVQPGSRKRSEEPLDD
ncbi:DNA topoisomerase I [Enhygromyxa salina]|uniref:DNA topoisomerase I n=1 Tax=Enhygromyxa salina TaxID=215803 RepID=A0A0C1Z5A5_9BACT|nr:tetratricopeptide repeat protein [Enhygromyxa salina]KIG12784.1 DNA topoisomerase I [Enhygromyxa salina]